MEPWHWWVISLCVIVIEALKPSGVFAAIAVATAITGGILMKVPDFSWQLQLGLSATLSLVLAFLIRLLARTSGPADERFKAQASTHIGREVTLDMPIQNGFGEARLDENFWELKGPDLPRGTVVKIVAVDGNMLAVHPVKFPEGYRPPGEDDED